MKLDNKPRAGKIKLFYMVVPFIIVVSTALIYLVYDSRDFIWAVIGGVLMGLFFFGMAYLKLYYISFYAGPDKVRLRYKSLSPFPTQNKSIQIDSNKLNNYKTESILGGLKKHIIFFMTTPGGVAAFPKTSISTLNKAEVVALSKALDLIIKLNKADQTSE